MRRWCRAMVCWGAAAAAIAAGVAGPVAATEPTASQPAAAASPIPGWLDQLNAPDPSARAEARYRMMGLSTADLPALRELVRSRRATLTPTQANALHEVVVQVYLAGESYVQMGSPEDPNHSAPEHFIGVRPRLDADVDGEEPRLGVAVGLRFPGFPAARALRDGDMILNVVLDTTVAPDRMPNMATHSFPEFSSRVLAASGRPFTLVLLRDGQRVSVPVRPVGRPVVANDRAGPDATAVEAFMAARSQRADAYWQERFVTLLEGDDGPTTGPSAAAVPVTID